MPAPHHRYLCIHGHFYQPPRENPFTGAIPREPGAEPYPNFNARINAECYQPNATLGNFRRLNFDIGPTLTTWLASQDPATLRQIVGSDRWAVRYHGSGPAMAQSYHHTILPLDSSRDQRTQVRWGIRDFQHRFGRRPLGLWLPETAADLATLDVLAEAGIRYTILAPWQAAEPVQPGRPYTVALPSGRSLTVFFYDGELSSLVSFHPNATISAPHFVADHLLPRYGDPAHPRLLLIATDGELYGHHQPFRDLFLQDLFQYRLEPAHIQSVTLEQALRLIPERPPVRLHERTSWSCHHGVTRWAGDCACTEGDGAWKASLRGVCDELRDQIDGLTVEATAGLLDNVWAARDDYIDVILGLARPTDWLRAHAARPLTTAEDQRVLTLMAAQQHRLAMYASCAYFWDDVARIEPRNAIAHALRAVHLIESVTNVGLELVFQHCLRAITSWRTRQTAADIVAPLIAAD